jgi:hypothetical protein
VALQNAIGWTDSHLHDFELPSGDTGKETWIGMPDFEGDEDRKIRPEHDERLDRWLHHPGERFFYNCTTTATTGATRSRSRPSSPPTSSSRARHGGGDEVYGFD